MMEKRNLALEEDSGFIRSKKALRRIDENLLLSLVKGLEDIKARRVKPWKPML